MYYVTLDGKMVSRCGLQPMGHAERWGCDPIADALEAVAVSRGLDPETAIKIVSAGEVANRSLTCREMTLAESRLYEDGVDAIIEARRVAMG